MRCLICLEEVRAEKYLSTKLNIHFCDNIQCTNKIVSFSNKKDFSIPCGMSEPLFKKLKKSIQNMYTKYTVGQGKIWYLLEKDMPKWIGEQGGIKWVKISKK